MFPLLKWPGGKFHQKDHIVGHFPTNYESMIYFEPFIGGGSILLNKKPSKFEIVSDINPRLICLWNIVKYLHVELMLGVNIEYSEENFQKAIRSEFNLAESLYIKHRMSRGGLGKNFSKSDRLRGGQMGDKNAYENAVKSIPKIANRVKDTLILCMDAVSAIKEFDNSGSFSYLDSPYMKETRVSKDIYEYEMSDDEHADLLDTVKHGSGLFLISGYNSKLYNDMLSDWNKVEKTVKNSSGQNKKKNERTEVLWKNY